jgi:uncharacterized protein YaaQ
MENRLLVAFVQEIDTRAVSDALRSAGFRFTRLASAGGFLDLPNSTFLLAVDAAAVPVAVAVFREACVARDVEVPLVLTERLQDWQERVVHHGGATILVVDLAELIRV